ncbi:MAG TPA: HAD-IB family hydrolase [Actinomycetota bacterium]|nr:HAD-IB family hydrolase [Actinomycetota bacterium]
MENNKRAAFFDLDKTLIPGSSLFLLARGLYDRDMFRVRDLAQWGWGQLMFRLRGENTRDMDRSRESTLEWVKGRSREELMQWGREIAAERILPIVYEDIVRVIEGHRERGDLTYLVTAAPIEIAQTIANELKMHGAVGTVSEVNEYGYYTGRLVGDIMHGPAKATAVAELAKEQNLDLAECAAYSDSINDLPLLESVGFPHAVNPEAELRRIALNRGWPIHELRTRRRAVLIGIPAGLGGVALFSSGLAIGAALERRRARATGLLQRASLRIRRN